MSRFSISAAWEETKAVLARDGRLFASVALALIVLPAVIAGVISPNAPNEAEVPRSASVVVLIVSLISIAGQLALVRLALAPSVTVASAISHGVRRFLLYFVAIVILGLATVILAIPFAIALVSFGFDPDRAAAGEVSGGATMLIVVMVLVFIFLWSRFLMAMPVAGAERAGPIAMLRRSWQLSEGHWTKLFLFFLLVMIAGALIVLAVSMVVGSLVLMAFGTVEPMSLAALILALFEGIITGVLSVIFTLMLTRIYVQLSGRDTVEAAAAA